MGTGDVCRVPPPQQRYTTGEPGKLQGRDCVGIVEVLGYRTRGVSIRGKRVLSRNLGYKTKGGGRHVAKRSSDPRVTYPEVKVQVQDLVRVVGIVAPFTLLGVGTRGKSVYRAPGG